MQEVRPFRGGVIWQHTKRLPVARRSAVVDGHVDDFAAESVCRAYGVRRYEAVARRVVVVA